MPQDKVNDFQSPIPPQIKWPIEKEEKELNYASYI